jgi:DDE superfamily endonuclease
VNSPALIAHIRFIRLKNFPDRLSVSTKSLRSSPWSGRKAILSCQTDARLTGQSLDYKRHGTTTLFAALEVATRRIIAVHSKRRRRVEFLGFMNSLVAAFPDRKLCVILNNVDTHKKNERWLMKHSPSVSISPIRSSWLNQVAFIGYTTRRPSDSSGRAAEHIGAEPGLIMANCNLHSTGWQCCLKNYTIITRFACPVVGEGESDCLISV